MAKTKRVTKRYYRPRAKYSSNIQEFSSTNSVNDGLFYLGSTLATNPTQSTLGVSQLYTVKNFEIDFTFEAVGSTTQQNIEDIAAYIMYLPQGMAITADYNIQHPEYIMNYKYYGSPTQDVSYYQPYRIKTRMARKLNTGDSVILFIKGNNNSAGDSRSIELHGVVRWWTKAN